MNNISINYLSPVKDLTMKTSLKIGLDWNQTGILNKNPIEHFLLFYNSSFELCLPSFHLCSMGRRLNLFLRRHHRSYRSCRLL